MAKKAARTLRDLRIAARDGDHAAARSLLRRQGKPELAAEIRRGKPFPPRVQRMVDAICAGTGTHDQLSAWEIIDDHGVIRNDLCNEDWQ